jgi:hypothetical protein
MKKVNLIVFAIALLLGMNVSAQEQVKPALKEQPNAPKVAEKKDVSVDTKKGLEFKKMEIVRENIPYGTDDMFVFEFKNESKQDALITGVQTSCGCTTANKPEEPVKPGKSSSISVKYDTKRVGQFTKTITVSSNVSEPIILTIKGSVLPETPVKEDGAQPVQN